MGFFRVFSAGRQPKKSAEKIRTPNSAQAITKSAKSAKKIRTQKSAPKNPREKSTTICPCKSPNQSMRETKSSKPVTEEVVKSVPHLASHLSCLEAATPVLHRPPHPNQ